MMIASIERLKDGRKSRQFGMDTVLDKCVFESEKLLQFGFAVQDGAFYYAHRIMQGRFELRIMINDAGKIKWDVWDVETEDTYPLVKITTVCGAFVGKVRMACDEVFREIVEQCGRSDVFKSKQALLIKNYVRERYGDEFEYLWEKTPENAVFRRKDNQKWYGAVLTVKRDRIGLKGEEKIEVLDLRGKPEEIAQIVDGERYFPAYHMNKKSWLTICLDGRVNIAEIYRRIDESYQLAKK